MTPEEEARQLIDELLEAAGWQVQDYKDLNLGAGLGVAVREFPLKTGSADYLLFVNRKADDPEASPSEGQIEKVFPKGPVLILLDEVVVYMARFSDRGQGNMLVFLNSLVSVVGRRPQTVLIVTDPAGQAAYAPQSANLAKELSKQQGAAQTLNTIFDRKVSDFDPIGKESAQVITRRLFRHIDQAAAQAASAIYHSLYARVLQELPGTLPPDAAGARYAEEIVHYYSSKRAVRALRILVEAVK